MRLQPPKPYFVLGPFEKACLKDGAKYLENTQLKIHSSPIKRE